MICSITGHRPAKFPRPTDRFLEKLEEQIRQFYIDYDIRTVLAGGAIGMDMIAAETAMNLGIRLNLYLPFPNHHVKWSDPDKDRHTQIINYAEKVDIIQDTYSNYSYFERNAKLVEDCDRLLCLWNPEIVTGGTFWTVDYAAKQNKPITNLWD